MLSVSILNKAQIFESQMLSNYCFTQSCFGN